MRIVFLNEIDELWNPYLEKLKREFSDVEFISSKDYQNPEDYVSKADGIICTRLDIDTLKIAEKLKIIFIPWTGVDSLPIDEIKKRGTVIVSNTHGNAEMVAERALTLCLALLGRVIEFHNNLSKGIWGDGTRKKYYNNFWVSLRNNVILSPHVGSSTIEGFKGMIAETFENIVAFLKTGKPIYQVDLKLKY